jgi:hypothetical protein
MSGIALLSDTAMRSDIATLSDIAPPRIFASLSGI